jgi:hypothetical protein
MSSDGYQVGLVIDNRTSGARIRIDRPTITVQAEAIGDVFPLTIEADEERGVICSLYAGMFDNAGKDNLVMPISITSGGATVSGTIRMYTGGGSHYPDYVFTELSAGELRTSSRLDVGGFDTVMAGMGSSPVGTVTLVFSELGSTAVTQGTGTVVNDAIKLVVSAMVA